MTTAPSYTGARRQLLGNGDQPDADSADAMKAYWRAALGDLKALLE